MAVDDTAVLVAGAGPVGLMTAVELRRRGVDVMIVDPRTTIAPWAKAVGVQPRTLELWDAVGVARDAVDAGTAMRGQLAFVNGEQVGRTELALPGDIPYRFVAVPQYETERILGAELERLGTRIQRGRELVDFVQDESGVTVTLRSGDDETIVRASYLVGCDGAHSRVRKVLGLSFDGAAFAEEYMLGDVEVDWDLPPGYVVRSSHQTDGSTDDLLVCIPLPGRNRYRMSMLVPPELSTTSTGTEVAHGLESGRAPGLHHIQAVLDRLAPRPTTASHLRWSSVFRISHRLVDRYGVGRVFVAGDAAHIHPPTGAQGMNTGIQDACNLGWKLALAAQGAAAPGLLETYHAERHPIGEEVVGRTVRAARTGIGTGEKLTVEQLILREGQLLLGYPDSPLSAENVRDGELADGPRPGMRAPDAAGLAQDPVGFGIRWHEMLRHPAHTLLLWAPDPSHLGRLHEVAAAVARFAGDHIRCRLVTATRGDTDDVSGPVMWDRDGNLGRAYGLLRLDVPAAYLIRPDGYVGFRSSPVDPDRVIDHLRRTFHLTTA